MVGHTRARGLFLAAMALVIAGLVVALLAGCGGTSTTSTTTAATAFDQIAGMMNNMLNNPANMTLISAKDLNGLLTDGNPNNDPLIIDVRSSADYTTASSSSPGHIPTAINIPFRDMASADSIAKIKTELAKHSDNTIVVHCYTAHTQSIDFPILYGLAQQGKLGTPAPKIEGLDWGMLGYNTVEKPPSYTNTFSLVTASTTSASNASLPSISGDLQSRAQVVLKDMPGRLNVAADQTINKLPESAYTVIDIRSATDYAKGHMPGAVNLPYQDLFKKSGSTYPNLAKIDRTKPILVVGNRQEVEEYVATGLNLLGISQSDSSTGALGFDIATWNNTVGRQFTAADRNSFPTVTGTAPGSSK